MSWLDKLEALAHQINQEILEHPLVVEFKKLEQSYKNNEYLKGLEKKIVEIQKEIVIVKSKKQSSVALIEEYDRIKAEYYSNPLVVNYQKTRDELDGLLQDINNYLNSQLVLDKSE